MGTPVGTYANEFDPNQYPYLLGTDTIGKGVVKEMNGERGGEPGFRVIHQLLFNNPDGTFSGGTLLLGAATRELAEQYQDRFVHRVNTTLRQVGATFRLGTPGQRQ